MKTIYKTYRFACLIRKAQEMLRHTPFGCWRFAFSCFLETHQDWPAGEKNLTDGKYAAQAIPTLKACEPNNVLFAFAFND